MTTHAVELTTYETLAAEYYDAARHPTCSNFALASRKLLMPWLESSFVGAEWVCEVGPGRSLVAEWLHSRGQPLDQLILVESSPGMATYSHDWMLAGARLIQADARQIPVRDSSISVVVGSLGDPYNELSFWLEARRVLRPGGRILFTTPAYEWAEQFRRTENSAVDVAQFELENGRLVSVPSLVRTDDDQLDIIKSSGLEILDVAHATVQDLVGARLSPKLVSDGYPNGARIVSAYCATAV